MTKGSRARPVGEGMGASDFSWSALVMELADRDPAARFSHLEPTVIAAPVSSALPGRGRERAGRA